MRVAAEVGWTLVVPPDSGADCGSCLNDAREVVLPNTLLLRAPEEALDYAVLLRSVRRDELVAEAAAAACGAKAPNGEDQPVIAPDDRRRAVGTERPGATRPRPPLGVFGLAGSPTKRELLADDLAVAVDDCGQVAPSRRNQQQMCVRSIAQRVSEADATLRSPRSRQRCHLPLVHEPALGRKDAVDGLRVHERPSPHRSSVQSLR